MSAAPRFRPDLQLADRTLDLGRPVLMGVVNANPDSFSDPGHRSHDAHLEQVHAMVAAGATVIDVGGQSGITNVAEVDPSEETDRVLPLVEAIVAELPHVVVSVDTYKPAVAAATLAAGA
ncbi:MAG: dihydropteroate synthase, partial [Aquihabitans sp.]